MRNTYHTFDLHIDLRDEELTNDNLNEVVAKLVRDAADRIARGDRVGGFHSPDKGYSLGGGFAFYDGISSRPSAPSMKEQQRIIKAIATGELTRENKDQWRGDHLLFASEAQFDVTFEAFIATKEAEQA